jgi:type IV pilus assembly protein PilA
MIQKLRERSSSEGGFTLVELLVVMLILGLLAAIAIPSFFNQRDKAKDSSAKEAVRTAQTAMETYSTDHNGSYSLADEAALVNIEPTLNDVNSDGRLHVDEATDTAYTITVDSTNTPNTFSIARDADGNLTYDCEEPDNDGCPSGGWGGE